VAPEQIDKLGPVIGRGALWVREDVKGGTASDPFLIAGYERKGLHLVAAGKATVAVEVDEDGSGSWKKVREIEHAGGHQWLDLSDLTGTWLRLFPSDDLARATASFHFSNSDERRTSPEPIFAGLATATEKNLTGGLIRARGGNRRTLAFAAMGPDGEDIGGYELQADLTLTPADAELLAHTKEHTKIPAGVVSSDAASVIFTDDAGKRWRLPKGDAAFDKPGPLGDSRAAREVATERDLFHAHDSFYELPANNAGGFAKVRPVSTHNLRIHDFCSYRGLFVMTGIAADAPGDNPHLIRSADGKAALWAGAIDDIWKMGKPRGQGGPWKDTAVKAGEVSDPYLMTAYDKKSLTLSSDKDTVITAEIDISGDGNWVSYRKFEAGAEKPVTHEFPGAFSAYWIRFKCDEDAKVTAQLDYR
jgi:hypothetical protein